MCTMMLFTVGDACCYARHHILGRSVCFGVIIAFAFYIFNSKVTHNQSLRSRVLQQECKSVFKLYTCLLGRFVANSLLLQLSMVVSYKAQGLMRRSAWMVVQARQEHPKSQGAGLWLSFVSPCPKEVIYS